jgi:diadenylate cyclase
VGSTDHLESFVTAAREEVLAAVTLSEVNGRVTVFRDGGFEVHQRGELGGHWRVRR